MDYTGSISEVSCKAQKIQISEERERELSLPDYLIPELECRLINDAEIGIIVKGQGWRKMSNSDSNSYCKAWKHLAGCSVSDSETLIENAKIRQNKRNKQVDCFLIELLMCFSSSLEMLISKNKLMSGLELIVKWHRQVSLLVTRIEDPLNPELKSERKWHKWSVFQMNQPAHYVRHINHLTTRWHVRVNSHVVN